MGINTRRKNYRRMYVPGSIQGITIEEGAATVSPSTLLNGIVAYWKMDEGPGQVRADSHNGYDAAEIGGDVASGAGKIATAAHIDPANSRYLLCPAVPNLHLDFTIAGWVNNDSYQAKPIYGQIYDSWGRAWSGHGGPWLRVADNFQIPFTLYAGAGNDVIIIHARARPVGQWTFFAMVHNVATKYVGAYDDFLGSISLADSGNYAFAVSPNTRISHYIGAHAAGTQFEDGLIDEMGIWSRVLTVLEIEELWNGGAGLTYPFL